jgi:hypothetical protein
MQLGPLTLADGYLAIAASATIEELEGPAEKLFLMQKNAPWWIGDFMLFGERRFGDDIWQAVPPWASESMIGRYIAHSTKFKPTNRVPAASWTLHSMCTKYDPMLRKAMLNHAVANGLSAEDFREYLKERDNAPKEA